MREKYVYEKLRDFIAYLDDCVETKKDGDFDGVVSAMDRFAMVYPMFALSPAKEAARGGYQDEATENIGDRAASSAIVPSTSLRCWALAKLTWY